MSELKPLTPSEVMTRLGRATDSDLESVGAYFNTVLSEMAVRGAATELPAAGEVCYDTAAPLQAELEKLPEYIQDKISWTQARHPGRRIVVSELQTPVTPPASPRLRLVKG